MPIPVMNSTLKFKKPLVQGLILARPNRFIMKVLIGKKIYSCYCPVTGRIGSLDFNTETECLVSKNTGKGVKLRWTVEAIKISSLNGKDDWIGINQTRANEYIQYFIVNGKLKKISSTPIVIKREVKIGKSKIDFVINGNHLIEVKTFLLMLPNENKLSKEFHAYSKIIQQYQDLIISKKNDFKCSVIFCYLFDSPMMISPFFDYYPRFMRTIVKKALDVNIEHWQVNLRLSKKGLSLIKYKKIG